MSVTDDNERMLVEEYIDSFSIIKLASRSSVSAFMNKIKECKNNSWLPCFGFLAPATLFRFLILFSRFFYLIVRDNHLKILLKRVCCFCRVNLFPQDMSCH